MSKEHEPGHEDQPAQESLGFGQAMEELESILQRIESDETDIDQLALELAKAAELLELCRGKVRRAELEINQVVEKL